MAVQRAAPTASLVDQTAVYASQLKQLEMLRSGAGAALPGMNELMRATGGFHVTTVNTTSAVDKMTTSIMKQKVSLSAAVKDWDGFKNTINGVIAKQTALQKAMVMQAPNAAGKNVTSLYTPTGITADMASMETKMAVTWATAKGIGQSVQDWGKNMQWSGRQITAGFAMPLALAGAGLAKLAYDTDAELTKIVKMYSTTSENITDGAQRQIAKEQELAQVRKYSYDNAVKMAKQYGEAINTTLETESYWASQGYKGQALMDVTNQVVQTSTVGSISGEDATNLVQSVMAAYKILPQQLQPAMDFLNALKNSTNLTMQDFADAIPKVGATITNLVPDSNKALQQTGVLLTAMKEGGISASEGANALKTAVARAADPVPKAIKYFDGLKDSVTGAMGIDVKKISADSGGNILDFMTELSKHTKDLNPDQLEIAMKDLFGIQQSNRMMVLLQQLQKAQSDPAHSQVAKAMEVAAAGQDNWADVRTQEVQQFQESASGQLKIAVQTLKGQLIDIGGPFLKALTPIVGVLQHVVTAFQAIPGPAKTALGILLGFGAISGPIMMMIGIFANWTGSITKMVAALGNLGNSTKLLTEEEAAEAKLQESSLQTKDANLQATSTLALRMRELVDVMQTMIQTRETLLTAEQDSAKAEEASAKAQGDAAQAAKNSLAAQKEQAQATEVNVEATLAWVTALNEQAEAARRAQGVSYGKISMPNGAGWGPGPNAGLWGPAAQPVKAPLQEPGMWATDAQKAAYEKELAAQQAAVAAEQELAALAKEEVTARRARVQALIDAKGIDAAGLATVGTAGNSEFIAGQDAVRRRNPSTGRYMPGSAIPIEENVTPLSPEYRAKVAEIQAKYNQTLGNYAVREAEAVLAPATAEFANGAIYSSAVPGPKAPVVATARRTGTSSASQAAAAAEQQARATQQAETAAAGIANQTAKTKTNWGGIAGSMMGVSLAAMSFDHMQKDSGGIMDKLGSAAGILMGISMSGLPTLIAGLGKEGSKLTTVFANLGGTMGRMWTGFKTAGVGALTLIGNSVKALLTTPLGIALAITTAIVAASLAIDKSYKQILVDQQQIDKSTGDWATLLGYTSKTQAALSGATGGTTEIASYTARQAAVQKLAEANGGLVDALGRAKKAQDGYNQVYNLSLNEALKVKVDGGTTTQAKEAFDVALQAAGLNNAEIQQLHVRFDKINLDDPQALKDQLNNQISAAVGNIKLDTKGPGLLTSIGSDLGELFHGNFGNSGGFVPEVAAQIDAFSHNVWDSINNSIQNGDKDGVTEAGKNMADSLDKTLQSSFTQLEEDPKYTAMFKKYGINSATQLQTAVQQAYADLKNGKKLTVEDTDLIQSGVSGTGQFLQMSTVIQTSLDDMGKAAGLQGPQLDDFKNKVKAIPALAPYFASQMTNIDGSLGGVTGAAAQAAASAAELRTALEEVGATGQDAMDLVTTDATAVTNSLKKTFQTAQSEAVSYAQEIFSQQQQAAAQAIQNSAKLREQGMQNATKRRDQDYTNQQKAMTEAADAENKAISQKYKNLGKSYDAQVKQAQDGAKAQTDAISNQIKALQKEDDVRQKLFDNEKTRLQRLAAMQNNNIDFNAALNSGNLDEAARVYTKNSSEVQTNALTDQQAALSDASKAHQDALQAQIDSINTARDTYVQAIQDQKDALSDLQQAEEDAAKKRQQDAADTLTQEKQAYDDARAAALQADQDKTQSAVTNSNNQFAAKKRSLDMEIAAITASIPATQEQYNAQIAQIEAAYQKYGVNLQQSGQGWAGYVGDALQWSIQTQAAALQSDIGWQDIGNYIQSQMTAGSGASIGQVVNFLKTGQWDASMAPSKVLPWKTPDQKTNSIQNQGITRGAVAGANHIGGFAGANGLTQRSREGVPLHAPLYQSEYMTILKQGEFVVNKSASERYAPLLDAINKGTLYSGQTVLARHAGGPVNDAFAGNMGAGMAGLTATTQLALGAATMKAAQQAISQAKMQAQDEAIWAMTGGNANITKAAHNLSDTLAFGRSQQGKPYIWGGAGPAGQDCSGFMSVLYNFLVGSSPGNGAYPWGRDWTTASFEAGRNFGPWVRTGRSDNSHGFRIGVSPGSHMAGTINGINVESGSGHGPMVGGKALGAGDKSFPFQYYLPAADIPQLKVGGVVQYDNTLANLHRGETVLTAPLTQSLQDNVANGLGSTYHVSIDMSNSQFDSQIDFEKGVLNALQKLDKKNGRNRTIT